jgi:hypothetical protein
MFDKEEEPEEHSIMSSKRCSVDGNVIQSLDETVRRPKSKGADDGARLKQQLAQE